MFDELATVVLDQDIPAHGLVSGDVGAVVHRYQDGAAYEVEFVRGDGRTVAVVTVEAAAIRLFEEHEILHVRRLAA